jgi:glycosyltransferase involved in cell wall biosynthesis
VRVLHVVSSDRFAGVERYIAYVAPALAARGCEVVVVGGDPAAMRAHLDGRAVDFLAARNVVEAAWHVAGHRHVDVLHAHMTSAEWALMPVRPFTRAAFVATRHFAAPRGRPGIVRRASRLVPRVLDRQLAISRFVAATIGEPAVVLTNGVPEAHPAVPGARERVVVVLQRLETEKDTALALDAWVRSRAPASGWRLLVAGQGSQAAGLRAQVAALALDASVEFLGQVADVPALLGRAGVLLATAPSEPFGLSVVEAMAAGVPVVAAAGGAHLETVGTCTTDYLFLPGDVAACADRLDALVGDPGARVAYGRALQEHQRAHFDLEDHVDRLLEIYRQVVAERAR